MDVRASYPPIHMSPTKPGVPTRWQSEYRYQFVQAVPAGSQPMYQTSYYPGNYELFQPNPENGDGFSRPPPAVMDPSSPLMQPAAYHTVEETDAHYVPQQIAPVSQSQPLPSVQVQRVEEQDLSQHTQYQQQYQPPQQPRQYPQYSPQQQSTQDAGAQQQPQSAQVSQQPQMSSQKQPEAYSQPPKQSAHDEKVVGVSPGKAGGKSVEHDNDVDATAEKIRALETEDFMAAIPEFKTTPVKSDNRPPFFPYGWKNTSPSTDKYYLMTHSSMPSNENQVFPFTVSRQLLIKQYDVGRTRRLSPPKRRAQSAGRQRVKERPQTAPAQRQASTVSKSVELPKAQSQSSQQQPPGMSLQRQQSVGSMKDAKPSEIQRPETAITASAPPLSARQSQPQQPATYPSQQQPQQQQQQVSQLPHAPLAQPIPYPQPQPQMGGYTPRLQQQPHGYPGYPQQHMQQGVQQPGYQPQSFVPQQVPQQPLRMMMPQFGPQQGQQGGMMRQSYAPQPQFMPPHPCHSCWGDLTQQTNPNWKQTYCSMCYQRPQIHPDVAEAFWPQQSYELNPKLLKYVPPRIMMAIRPAGKPTPKSEPIGGLMNQFD